MSADRYPKHWLCRLIGCNKGHYPYIHLGHEWYWCKRCKWCWRYATEEEWN